MFKRLLMGAVAGTLATLPMSGVIWGLRKAGVYHRQPAPERVAERMRARAGVTTAVSQRLPLDLAQHFAVGAGIGVAFSALTAVVRPMVAVGVLAGLVVWKLTYDGWLPAAGLMPPPEKDEKGRAVTTLAAHAVFGLALGVIMDRITARRDA